LGVLEDVGTIEVGKRADLAFWRIERPAQLCYGLGGNPRVAVMYRGKIRELASARDDDRLVSHRPEE
ncbi:MAG TPA: hypothetical protein VNH39_00355, partial [Steroidobacteraceae bacterium]|nr:hypothetical protein [Steroidobacteraceae bacterium]